METAPEHLQHIKQMGNYPKHRYPWHPVKMHLSWIVFLFLLLLLFFFLVFEDSGPVLALFCGITILLFQTTRLSPFKQMANDDVSSAWRD